MNHDGERAVHVWLPRETVREIDYLAVDWDMNRTEAIRRLITVALSQYNPRAKRDRLLAAELPADVRHEARP